LVVIWWKGVLMTSEPEVLIAGAGPTGLTLAGGLLANGVAARVVDKAVEPAGTSRALGLQPRGIEVVERLGALNRLPERALQVEQIVVHLNGIAERFLLVDVHADLPLSRRSIYAWLDGARVFGAFPLPGQDLWRSFRIHRRLAETYRNGRILLAGDAAMSTARSAVKG
jgi:2-polyprenyl-6-methoxyphenol hydroxylase-like FAD-dependent oxidoreductase